MNKGIKHAQMIKEAQEREAKKRAGVRVPVSQGQATPVPPQRPPLTVPVPTQVGTPGVPNAKEAGVVRPPSQGQATPGAKESQPVGGLRK